MEKSYTMTIAGLQRELPLCRLNEHVSIAAFVIFGDVPLTVASSTALLEKADVYKRQISPRRVPGTSASAGSWNASVTALDAGSI